MKIHCPDCQHMVPAADINIQTSLARCLNCDSVFNIQAQMGAVETQQEEVGLPKGIRAEVAGGALVIERRWFHPKYIFIGFFAGIWNLFLVFWYLTAAGAEGPGSLLAMLFPLGHVAVGLGLGYYSLAGFLNKTIIRATPDQLTVRHRPLKWRGEHTLGPKAIEQLYVQESVKRGKNGTTVTYEVHVMLTGRRSKKLVSGLPRPEQAVFIAQQVEKHLDIRHVPVPGEYQPPIQVLRSGERLQDIGGLSLGHAGQDGELSAVDEELSAIDDEEP